jgi:hypothetical protein
VDWISSGFHNPLMTNDAPASAKARAMPRPIPLVEPVTTATFPRSVPADVVGDGLSWMFMAGLLKAAVVL